MNEKVICTRSKIEDIAAAIRNRNQVQTSFTLDQMPVAIGTLNNIYYANFEGATPNTTITATDGINTYSTISDANGDGSFTLYQPGVYTLTDTHTLISQLIEFKSLDTVALVKIPLEYKELQYVQSSGSQYINLGIKGHNGLDCEYKCNFTSLSSSAASGIGGCYEVNSSLYFGMIRTNYKLSYHYNGTSSPIEIQTIATDTDYDIKAHLYQNEQYFIVNGTKSAVQTRSQIFISSLDMWLFGINSVSPLYSNMKVYYFRLLQDNDVIMDLVPCYRKADTKVGMYDLISGQFLTVPTGVSELIAGPEI